MFKLVSKGNFDKTKNFLKTAPSKAFQSKLDNWGTKGVNALRAATPRDSGLTAASWGYEIVQTSTSTTIVWTNTNDVGGAPLAVLLQYGHGTNNGGYVEGRDFINPAMRSIFDSIASEAWRELTRI